MLRPLRAVAILGLLACGCPSTTPGFYPSSGVRFPSYPPNCTPAILGTHPGPEYREIGQLLTPAGTYFDPYSLVDAARRDLCAAGADVVVAEVNGTGYVVRGIVFRRMVRQPVPAASPPRDGCDPICSPGFACRNGQCIPVCNPACEPGEVCGRDRLCHPAPPPTTST